MKKHQATTRDIPTAQESQATICQGIEPLQVQLNREQLTQKSDACGGRSHRTWQRLAANAERINQLSAELEAALFDLKEIASAIERQQQPKTPNKIFDYQAIAIPYIQHKKPGLFVLKAKAVDLFAEEKAAYELAQQLRNRTKTRLKRSHKLSLARISWRLGKFLQKLASQWQNKSDRSCVDNKAKIDLPPTAKTTKIENRKRFVLQR